MSGIRLFVIYSLKFILTVLFLASIVFIVTRIIPGDPVTAMAGVDAAPEDVEKIKAAFGLDRPLWQQYTSWVSAIMRFDFGISFKSGKPVVELILQRLPITLILAVGGLVLALLLAVPAAIVSVKSSSKPLRFAFEFMNNLVIAIPAFWLGIILLLLFAVFLKWLPLFGASSPRHYILPVFALGLSRAAVMFRFAKVSIEEEMKKPYVEAARGNGLSENRILLNHVLRNSFMPIITIAAIQFGYMLGGSVIIEQVFSIPGLGRLLVSSLYQRDFPVIQGGVLLVTSGFALVNLAADLLYRLVAPKIREDHR